MKKQVIAVMLSMMMAVGSVGGASVFAAETDAIEIVLEEDEDDAAVEDASDEKYAQMDEEVLHDGEENGNGQDRMEDDAAAEEDDDSEDISDISTGTEEEIDDDEDFVTTEENEALGDIVESGTCGENLTWTLDEEGTLTISGTGAMEDYTDSSCIFNKYILVSVQSVVIEHGIESIGSYAFYYCRGLTSVTIPDSVTSIGSHAFYNCSDLKNVTIPDSVTYIGDCVFRNCHSLTSVTIPNSVTSIGESAFYSCGDLMSVTIPSGVTSIEESVFSDCSSLTSVTIPNSVTSIGGSAFFGCGDLTSVTIPDSVTYIGNNAFRNCYSLTSVTIPNSVTSIGESAFCSCSSLESVTISNNVTSIKRSAFADCSSLTRVTIPDSITSIEDYAFSYCTSLTSIKIPESVTSIGGYAFTNCKSLSSVKIPSSITSIGESTFSDCSGLRSVTIPNSVTSIGNSAFWGCGGLSSVTIPDSVTSIGILAFWGCYSLTSVMIPDSVTSIGDSAFHSCSNLTSVTISNSVTSIGDNSFYDCERLTDVTIPNSVTSIGEFAFRGCSRLTNVTIPNSVTRIMRYAFLNCSRLESVTIPNSVTSIEGYAFTNCSGLTSIYFSGNAPYMHNTVFENVTAAAYYPVNDPTWTEDVRQNYGGTLTWRTWDPEDGQINAFHSGVFTINYESLSGSHEFYYDDLFFYSNNTAYNNALAVLTLGMELASYSYSSKENYYKDLPKMTGGYTGRAKNLRETYKTLGFTDAKYYGYDAPLTDSSDKVAYSFAKKTITNGTSTDTLVVVPIRGGGYGAEWASNFRVGDSGNSYGFDQAANTVLAELKKYLTGIEITGDLKLWITGYSRAAATANLLTHYINQKASSDKLGVPLNTRNIYTYTFATPNCYNKAIGDDSIMDYNIFNIISSNDMVPKMPLSYWGYKKYGQVMVLPTYTHNDVATEFERITGRKLGISNMASFWDGVSDSLYIVVRDNETYYHYYEEDVSGIFRDEFSNSEGSVASAFKNMLVTMLKKDPFYSFVATVYAGESYFASEAIKMSLDTIENMHHPEHYLSWLEFGHSEFATTYSRMSASDRNAYNNNLKETFENYKRYRIYCPVDVRVYSSDGELLVSIIDNEVVEDQLPCSVNGEEKSFYLLGDMKSYHIELTGSDAGSMSYFVDEYNNESEVVRSVYYYDIPLEDGIVYQDDVSMEIEDEQEDYSVTDGEFAAEKSLDTLTDHTETFSVEVENGAADKAYAAAGEAVMLYAILEEEQEFVRWESDDEDVVFDDDASPATFVKMPSKDIRIVAVLREKGSDGPLTDLSGATVTIPSVTFNGKVQQASVNVALDDKTLSRDTDYTVENDIATNAGTYQVIITGIGSYTGTITKTFLILPGKTTRGDMFNLANNVKVTWKEVPGAKYYKVYREGITDKKETQKEPVIVTERLVGWDSQPGLTNGHAYRYKIVASLTGKGDPSGDSTLSYSKLMYRLKTVVIRSVKNTAPGKVTVKYDKTTSGDSYVLQYCERQDMVGAKTKVVLGADTTSYTIGGLKKGKTYYISIRVRKKVNGIDYYTTFGVSKKITITK